MKEGSSRCQPMTFNLYILWRRTSAKHQSAFEEVLSCWVVGFLPSWREVPALMSEFCTYLNTEWDGGDVFHLGAYALHG
jgi:hypothetical protein